MLVNTISYTMYRFRQFQWAGYSKLKNSDALAFTNKGIPS